MTKEQFKMRWESDAEGGRITFNEIAQCAIDWGVFSRPKTRPIIEVIYKVLVAAGASDAEDFKPSSL